MQLHKRSSLLITYTRSGSGRSESQFCSTWGRKVLQSSFHDLFRTRDLVHFPHMYCLYTSISIFLKYILSLRFYNYKEHPLKLSINVSSFGPHKMFRLRLTIRDHDKMPPLLIVILFVPSDPATMGQKGLRGVLYRTKNPIPHEPFFPTAKAFTPHQKSADQNVISTSLV